MSTEPTTARSNAILARLSTLHPKLIDLSLGRIEGLLKNLGNPHQKLPPVIHVAGTNAKGSVIAFLKAMLEAQGKSVHAYTSPHLVHFHERIVLNGQMIEEDELASILDECERKNGGAPITHFEITTAAAFLAFSRHPADVVLLETGLGGQFDATNVIDKPALTIITPVDLDHQSFLGDQVEQIAREKAGIIKPGVPCIIGPQPDNVLEVLQQVADKVSAPLSIFNQEWSAYEEHGRLVYQDQSALFDFDLPALIGHHQIQNAGTALAALQMLNWTEDIAALENGLQKTKWPARLQRLRRGPLVDALPKGAELWLDGGHNAQAARALANAVADLDDNREQPLFIVCGMLEAKDAKAFLEAFAGLAHHVTTVPISGEAFIPPDILYEAARSVGLESDPAEDYAAAIGQISARPGPPPRILICGSLYLAGQVLKENG